MRKHRHGRHVHPIRTGSGYERPPLGPISSRVTRVRLLCLSYDDASTALQSPRREWATGKPHSSPPLRNRGLWNYGSYKHLERQMDELREHSESDPRHRLWYRSFWRVFIHDPHYRVEVLYPAHVLAGAQAGLMRIVAGMGTQVYVPIEISVACGVSPFEALAYATPWEASHERREVAA